MTVVNSPFRPSTIHLFQRDSCKVRDYALLLTISTSFVEIFECRDKVSKTCQNGAIQGKCPGRPASQPGRPAPARFQNVPSSTCMHINAKSTQLQGGLTHMQHTSDEESCHFINPTLGSVKSSIQGVFIMWLRKKHNSHPRAAKEAHRT